MSSKNDYEIVPYDPDRLPQILDVQAHHWGHDLERRRAYFDWKYHRNPYIADPLIPIALHRGEVVGMWGCWGMRWRIGRDRTIDIPCTGDAVVSPKHRKQGLFRLLKDAGGVEVAKRGYPHRFTISSGLIAHRMLLSDGWRPTGGHRRLLLGRTEQTDVEAFATFDSESAAGRVQQVAGDARCFASKKSRPDAMADLVERLDLDERIRPLRSAEYFAWRFQNPFADYRFLFDEDATGELQGYLVLQSAKAANGWDVRILDWEATDPVTRARLLRVVMECGSFQALSLWSAYLPEKVQLELREMGFRAWNERDPLGPSRPTVLIDPLGPGNSDAAWTVAGKLLSEPANWDLSMLSSDAY